jgi:hypothetical protein
LSQPIVFLLKPTRADEALQIWHVQPAKHGDPFVVVERDENFLAHATALRPTLARLLRLVEEERDRLIPAGPDTLARLRELGHRLAS